MTPLEKAALHLALGLDAFLAEHRWCWRQYGEGLDGGDDSVAVWIECACGGLVQAVAAQ
jgi:hypothetical protein